jgi:hypothetical protein
MEEKPSSRVPRLRVTRGRVVDEKGEAEKGMEGYRRAAGGAARERAGWNPCMVPLQLCCFLSVTHKEADDSMSAVFAGRRKT